MPHLYAIAIGSNRPHGRYGRPPHVVEAAIVRLDRIDALLHRPGGDYAVRLKDGTELDVSRARRDELQQRLGIK